MRVGHSLAAVCRSLDVRKRENKACFILGLPRGNWDNFPNRRQRYTEKRTSRGTSASTHWKTSLKRRLMRGVSFSM